MKKMKSLLVAASLLVAGSAMADSYNNVSISYNSDHYGYNSEWYGSDKDDDPSFSTNGLGLNYIHGFGLSSKLPMYLEVGANLNFNFYSNTEKFDGARYKQQFQNYNLAIPVNFAWKFNLPKGFTITPYTGINFRLNMASKGRVGAEDDGVSVWGDWVNYLKKDEEKGVDKDDVWNVFQMGWQIGARASWKSFTLGLQWGVDFIPAYSYTYKEEGFNAKYSINTTRFKLSLGYNF